MASTKSILIVQSLILGALLLYQLLHLPATHYDSASFLLDSPILPCRFPLQNATYQSASDGAPRVSTTNAFGACLLVMDDNFKLPEWLAYHYHVLPLRRLIVAVDPKSETSPTQILNRYRGLMQITEWEETDFMPPHLLDLHDATAADNQTVEDVYMERQLQFYLRCMALLRHEHVEWTALIDSDEFVVPNPSANPTVRLLPTPSNHTWTVYDYLQANKPRRSMDMIKRGCVSMHRLSFGAQESPPEQVNMRVPSGFVGRDFNTLRFRYHSGPNETSLAKCLVNLTKARMPDWVVTEINPHRPLKRLCSAKHLRIGLEESPLVVHHYTGSWSQWTSRRQDVRERRQTAAQFERLRGARTHQDDGSMRDWLGDFVRQVGVSKAQELLQGAGKVGLL